MDYLRAFSAELLKTRRTWAFTLSTLAPAGLTLFIFLVVMTVPDKEWSDVWIYYLRGVVWTWLLLMTPVYVALLLVLLASTDHRAGTWKLLLAQPVSRPPLYFAKLAVGLLLVAWSQIVLAAACLATGFLLPKLRPRLGSYGAGVDVPHLLVMLLLAYVAGLLMMAIHACLSMRSANFVLSLGVVMFAEIGNFFGVQQELLQRRSPWLLPFDAARLFGLQPRDALQHFWSIRHLVLVSVLGAAVITTLGVWDFARREI